MRAADFPPPFRPDEFISEPTTAPEDRIRVGVLVVGAGPAGLAFGIRFGQLLSVHPDVAERLGEVPLAVMEKGKQPGSQVLSGAILDPGSLRQLFPGRAVLEEVPSFGPVGSESVYVLTRHSARR